MISRYLIVSWSVVLVVWIAPLPISGEETSQNSFSNESSARLYFRGLAEVKKKNYEAAVDLFSQLIESGYEANEILLSRAEAYYKLKNYHAALDDVNGVLRVKPLSSRAYILRAAIYDEIGEAHKAL